ncbi:unnamed protein product [Bursaphelenchus xylophilus]|uniref:DNA topoisomerase 2 n=1 Tax=Bursaphelenchus xylophilus TaxID=6326 RepID=A0A1I7SRX4_BURXY|nr:unnamed protein product [Bursaphelenchus xylophilus]CAG9101747.1 unnamed protein product [Bursaphelenchus xylophilus]
MSDSESDFLDDSDSDFGAGPSAKKPKISNTPKKKAPKAENGTPKKTPAKKSTPKKSENGLPKDLAEEDLAVFTNIDKNKGKNLSIEEMYQRKSQLEHIMLRPDTYIGSIEFCEKQLMWVYDKEEDRLVQRDISYVPGLYKIFDEILVNAADNKQRDPKMNTIRIDIKKDKNEISIMNNGKGIPVVMHKVEKMYVPEMIFGTLLTSSNYNDEEKKVTGGRNGYGAKLCNIFSTKFTLETSSKHDKKKFKQTWIKNMTKDADPEITKNDPEDFTRVTFSPDLKKFKMDKLDDDIVSLMSRRAFDVAGSTKGVKVYLNGKLIPCQGFKQYVEQYTKNQTHDGEPYKVAYESVNPRWEIALTVSDRGFQQVSFANSIATTKGGRHVDYVVDQVVSKLIETIKKKVGKSGITVKPFQVKNHIWIFVNALVENPTFDSQTKETMTLQAKSFGSKCEPSEKFIREALKCGIVEAVMSWVRFKQMEQQDKKCSSKKTSKLKGIPKLEDANDAGTKNSHLCTLILTEGDSAKTMAVAGLGVVGRDRYGVFPLRGKMLNVRDANHKQIMDNAEINAVLKIVGLQYKLKYATAEEMKTLRYGKIMIMTDQDQDGSHIKGLVINFVHHNWPNLIKNNFIEEFITPIVKAIKNKEELSFFSIPEYHEWRDATPNWRTYKIKYYKGLGTSTAKEAKEYFSDMQRHRIRFKYDGPGDDNVVELAFSKKKIEERKEWLTKWMEERKLRREIGEADEYLYNKDTRTISYSEFVNKELVLFSNMDNERSIPSLVDGLKPGQRKVLFTCFKRADKREVKVAQLAGAVGEMSAYHHGEQSLMATIVNLAQDFVGSNNINLLLPIGQLGTRLLGGKDAASARYIFTQLNPVTRALFPAVDENVLRFLYEENQRIEPEWYCPIIPTVLVNGAEGIGTAWSTKIPNYNPREIVENIRRLIRGDLMKPLTPWYKKFQGVITKLDDTRYVCSGEIATLNEDTVEITELPVKTWTQAYKENVLEPMMDGSDKHMQIIDFKEYHTEETVKFVVKMTPEKLRQAEREGLHKVFKLQTVINTTSMVLFDASGCLRKFSSPEEICQEFFDTRRKVYIMRKEFNEGWLDAQASKLSEKARFILMKIKGELKIENVKKAQIVVELKKHNFKPDPEIKWREERKKKELEEYGEVAVDEEEEESEDDGQAKIRDYDYLLGMKLWSLSMEEKEKLLADAEKMKKELQTLQLKTWHDLYEEDLKVFEEALDKQEKKEKTDLEDCIKKAIAKLNKDDSGKRAGKKLAKGMVDVKPNPEAIRIAPTLDAMKEKYETKVKKAREPKDPNATPSPRKRKLKEENGENGEASTPKKPRKEKTTTPKPKKKKEWASDESEGSISSDDAEILPATPPPKRETTGRRAAAQASKSFVISDGEEEDSESDLLPATSSKSTPKVAGKKSTPKKKAAADSEDDADSASAADSDADIVAVKKPVVKKTTPKKATPKKREISSGSEDDADSASDADSDADFDAKITPTKRSAARKATPKKSAPKKKVVTISDDDADSASDADSDADNGSPAKSKPESSNGTRKRAAADISYKEPDSDSDTDAKRQRVVIESDDDEVEL